MDFGAGLIRNKEFTQGKRDDAREFTNKLALILAVFRLFTLIKQFDAYVPAQALGEFRKIKPFTLRNRFDASGNSYGGLKSLF